MSPMAHSEDVESGPHSKDDIMRRESVKHGDRALDLVGDQRVELTDADVRFPPFPAESTH